MAAHNLSPDSLDRERRGRIIGDDQHRGAIRARTRELLNLDGGGRRSVVQGGRKGASQEAVLKVISWTKTTASPMAQARYASRTRDSDPPGAGLATYNDQGRPLQGVQIENEIRSWNLKAEEDNLSAAAKQATPKERRSMVPAERLDKRQAVHIVFSVPSHAKADADRLGRAVDLALGETLREGGFRYVYTVHTDHSARPHVHLIIKAQSEPIKDSAGKTRTRQLRLGPRELEAMRQVFTRHAQGQGLNVIATRRQDREHMRAEILSGQAPLRENMKFHAAMKQTRQGRTFEVKAPSWYEQHGLDYERRRLAAASVGGRGRASTKGPTAGQGSPEAPKAPQKPARGLLGRLFGRVVGRSREDLPSPGAPQTGAAAGGRRGGYFENFDNYRDGKRPAEAKNPAEAKLAAHFAATHREPEAAAASFRAMLKEAPRLALWAAAKHPQAFGEPTGEAGPGIAWKDVRPLVDKTAREAAPRPAQRDPHSQEAMLAGERLALREATARARARAAPERAQLSMARSLARLADRIERETPTDPESKERAAHIRNLAQGLHQGAPATQAERRDQAARIHGAAGEKDKAALYRELEAQIRRRDQARAERKTADRPTPEQTTTPGGPQNGPAARSRRGGYFENFDNYREGARQAETKSPADQAAPAQRPGKAAPEKPERSMAGSLSRLANRIERQAPNDPAAKDQAAHIRNVARELTRGDPATQAARREQADRLHGAAGEKDKAALYRELEAQIRERDQARAKHRARHRDGGGRDL